jgi:catechol 2,3-dioxygenase-like lactoylglutathione lyase family enzyme
MPTQARLYRVILPSRDIEQSTEFYRRLFRDDGRRVSPGRHYFDCGEVILAVVDPGSDGDRRPARENSDHVYFAVEDVEAFHRHARAVEGWTALDARVASRPWGETSFYGKDPTGNPICFVEEGTVFTGK